MPIYEYECNACGDRHEFIQKFSEGPKRKCPSCGKSRLKKLMSAAAFHLKGSGWYVTDFRDKDGKKKDGDSAEATSESKSQSDSDSSSETKSDGKSETKSDSSSDSSDSKSDSSSTKKKDEKKKSSSKKTKAA